MIAGESQHRDAILESGRLDVGGVQRMRLTSAADYLEWNPSATQGLSCSKSGSCSSAARRTW